MESGPKSPKQPHRLSKLPGSPWNGKCSRHRWKMAKKRVGEFPRERAVESVRRTHVALKGPMATAVAQGPPSINVALRKELDLYANLRPVRNVAGVSSRWSGVDLVIVRENTEDLYAGLEHTVVPGVVESLKIITEHASTKIARAVLHFRMRARMGARKSTPSIRPIS